MVSKFLKQYLRLAEEPGKWAWVRSIRHFTIWKRKDLLSLDGEMKVERKEVEHVDVTTSSQEKVLQPWSQFNHSETTYLHGNQVEELLLLEDEKNSSLEAITKFVTKEEARIELLEKISALERRKRKYKSCDPAETWASRWVASPVAYLFPAERREEWLGDLYELNREMLHKGYPRWFVSIINMGRTVILALSAIKIKLSDFISLEVKRRE